jgi:hypothetical protein
MELGSYFLFLQEQIKDIIIINKVAAWWACCAQSRSVVGMLFGHVLWWHRVFTVTDLWSTLQSRLKGSRWCE